MKDLTGKGKPFHSALDKAAALLKRKVGTGAEFMQELKGLGGIKQAEIDERKLGEVMGMPRMTHDQFMANLATRPVPPIKEKLLGGDEDDPNWIGPYHSKWTLPGGENYREMLIKLPDQRYSMDTQRFELDAKLRRAAPEDRPAIIQQIEKLRDKYNQTPEVFEGVGSHFGGESGILASMRLKDRLVPDTEGPHNVKVTGGGGFTNVKHKTREDAERFADVKQQGGYRTEITPINKKKLLHLEELQSDWHQQGRDKGYIDPDAEQKLQQIEKLKSVFEELQTRRRQLHEQAKQEPDAGPKFDSLMEEANSITPKLLELNSQMHNLEHFERQQRDAVPNAPFKKNWEEMALKRLIHHAAENGYHGIVVTPGKEQADRYSLAKHINHVIYDEIGNLRAIDKDGRTVISEEVKPEKLPEYLGKEMADKILGNREKRLQAKDAYRKALKSDAPNEVVDPLYKEYLSHPIEYSGLDLEVGGEGMKGFYDKKVPNILNSIGKKYGVKTELNGHQIETEPAKRIPVMHERGTDYEGRETEPAQTKAAHYFPITEDMRKDITTNGLPLYAEGGIIRKAEGGNVQPSLAQMKLALGSKVTPPNIKDVGINEAINLAPKVFMAPDQGDGGMPAPGGVATRSGMPIGGIDMSKMNPGQQLMPQGMQQPQQPPQGAQPPQGGLAPQGPTPPMGNMLQMTPQGQAMSAMGGGAPNKPPSQGLAKGGQPSVDAMKAEMATKKLSKGVDRLAGGGQQRLKFAIQPAEKPTKGPEGFTPYDHENPTMKGLATAFDEAIAHHLSLSPEERAKNSVRASERVADIVGRTSNGAAKDLLGKNQKLLKSEKGYDGGKPVELPDGRGIETSGLALAPAYREGKFDTCPNHQSCKAECLGKTSGNYFKLGGGKDMEEFLGPRLNSLKKTHAFMHAPHDFAVKLHDEISDAKAIAAQNGNHLGLRLNVLSDINPRVHKAIINAHPDVTFYDYTKNNTDPIAPNHHYTYSSTGVSQPGVTNEHSNWKSMRRRLDKGDNVAMAFSDKHHLPEEVHCQETGKKYKVVDGDTHDFRPLDIQSEGSDGVIIGLKNKKATGKTEDAHVDSHGFFVHYDPKLQMGKNAKGQPVYARSKLGSKSMYDTIPQNRSVNIQKQESSHIPLSNDDGESK